jgi:excisionase family DNA binding protein
MDKQACTENDGNDIGQSYLTKAQLCVMLGITVRTLEGWMRRGHVPYYKIGRWVRFLEEDVHAHLRKYRVQRSNGFFPTRRSRKLEIVAERAITGKV